MPGAFASELGTAAATTNVATTTITLAAGKSASVGDLVVVGSIWGSGSQTASVADSKGNTWTAGTAQQNGTAGSGQVWWSILTSALTTGDTITVTRSGTSRGTLQALVFTGASGTSATVLDQQAGNKLAATGSTAPSSGATATTAGADIVVGFVGFQTVAGTVTPGSGLGNSSITSTVQTNNGFEHAFGYKIATGAAAETASFTLPSTAGWVCICATFKVAAAGSTVERAATLDATAAITAAGQHFTVTQRAATLDAASALTVAHQRDLQRQATVDATGAVSVAGARVVSRTASLDAVAVVTAAPQRELQRQATLDATSAVSAAGEIGGAVERAASLSATAAITAAHQRELQRAAALDATAAASASGVIVGAAVERAATLDATAAVAASGQVVRAPIERAATLTATTAVDSTGLTIRERAAALDALTAMTAVSQREVLRTAALTAVTAISAVGQGAPEWTYAGDATANYDGLRAFTYDNVDEHTPGTTDVFTYDHTTTATYR